MSTQTTVRVACDHCGNVHFEGLKGDRPQHVHVTFWSSAIGWDPDDLCEPCAQQFLEVVRDFGRAKYEVSK